MWRKWGKGVLNGFDDIFLELGILDAERMEDDVFPPFRSVEDEALSSSNDLLVDETGRGVRNGGVSFVNEARLSDDLLRV